MTKPTKAAAASPKRRARGLSLRVEASSDGGALLSVAVRRDRAEALHRLLGKLHSLREGSTLGPEEMAELIEAIEQADGN